MKFYILKPYKDQLFGRKFAYELNGKPYSQGDCDYCPLCGSLLTPLKWLPPQRLILSSSKPEKWGDFVFGTQFQPFVSAKFKSIFEQEELKSLIKFHPPAEIVKLGTKKVKDFPGHLPVYYMAEIPTEGAVIDIEASQMVFDEPIGCDKCKQGGRIVKSYHGLIIEDTSWKGYDIFRAWGGLNHIFVTERFKSVLEKYKLTNYLLYPAEQWWWEEPNLNPFYTHEDEKKDAKIKRLFEDT